MTDRSGLLSLPDPVSLANRSDERKKFARGFLGPDPWFPGTAGRGYQGVIDAYHGETGLPMDAAATTALNAAWLELTARTLPEEYRDGRLYDKRQPLILRTLAADTLFRRVVDPGCELPGVPLTVDEIIVCPYSSTVLLEEAVATLARPGGVLVCPEGYYKSASVHVAKYGLRMVSSPATGDDEFKIDPKALELCLDEYARQGTLCGVMLTLPGNPVVGDYTVGELTEIGRVLVRAGVPVICDMSFDLLVEGHVPIAAITVPTADGPVRLHDRVLTITGNSKAYNAFGPCKLGAACSGDARWLESVRDRLRVAFQRETTHLVRAVLEHTSEEYLAANRRLLRARVVRAVELLHGVNARHGANLLRPLGSSDGMFLTVDFDADLLAAAGVRTGSELEDLLLTVAGIDTVGLDRTGSARLGVRFNVVAPRLAAGAEQPHLLAELFDRLDHLLDRLRGGMTYPNALLEREIPAMAVAS
ncbi:aminotransferase class I/II-fold pyridoxal phosphate-dependent enzyme [Nocardia sp. 2]|uniref:Aminotransferase class I/II-fold pyridoxal phosphate-dependent enzyme n=1 Tax=Nocardia acididurans TaxID=2802282 RepID=A0ABS1MCA8_9NOCA|nr:aminotransferase class I/II-fold pyridoxal phosphate-dependent enzyme [Nocardia acididurans]MBL1078217.1 aminotransferase class I/II-fold pyridoxal phosphate-dependent enzyme [Nocardia acididurans]